MSTNGLNARQMQFALLYFSGKAEKDAYVLAGYSPKAAAACASRLLTNAKIQARLRELQEAAQSARVMAVLERKEKLSEIARGNLLDYQETGADGAWLNIGPESPNTGAIAEITSRTDEDGSVITRIKLHNPITAIGELNKMDGAYAPEKHDVGSAQFMGLLRELREARRQLPEGEDGSRSGPRSLGSGS